MEKLREKIAAQREKRGIKENLTKTKTLGESDDELDDTMVWVKRLRQIQREKEIAEKKVRSS